MNTIKSAVAVLALAAALPAVAGPYADALSACFSDNTTGKERKELARWIFVAMAAHPEIGDLSKVTSSDREAVNKIAGDLVTRLISQNCADRAKAAIKNEGAKSLQESFGVLGKLAMQELMTNPAVASSLLGYEKYIDKKKVEATFSNQLDRSSSDGR